MNPFLFTRYWIKARVLHFRFWRNVERMSKVLPPLDSSRIGTVMIIVSTGRTGTTWLAKLLATIPGVLATHEPVRHEQFAWAKAFSDVGAARRYAEFRMRYIRAEYLRLGCSVYVEANGALRRHVQALKQIDPSLYIPHVVRDGRDLVTSVMNRPSITVADPYYHFHDITGEFVGGAVSPQTKFEKACWLWKIENEFMAEHCDYTVRFEDMMTDYGVFCKAFCEPIGVTLSYDRWSKSLRKVENATRDVAFPGWEGWSDEHKRYFLDCCGDAMRKFGYSL